MENASIFLLYPFLSLGIMCGWYSENELEISLFKGLNFEYNCMWQRKYRLRSHHWRLDQVGLSTSQGWLQRFQDSGKLLTGKDHLSHVQDLLPAA